jgi:serine/threonine protein kinase
VCPTNTSLTSSSRAADLKPANILLDPDSGRAKLSDFGLARQHLRTTMDTRHLGVGTLPYMAPELLIGAHLGVAALPVTNRIDIYAFGMTLWEMLAGRPPWSHLNQPAMLAAVRALPQFPRCMAMVSKDNGRAVAKK